MKKKIILILSALLIFMPFCIANAEDFITFSEISIDTAADAVENSLVLPAEKNGKSITWVSDNHNVLLDNGEVIRPYPNDVENVHLTAYIEDNEPVTFNITVKAFGSKQEIVEDAAMRLSFPDISADSMYSIENDLSLPSVGANNTGIIWESDNPSLIAIEPDASGYIGEVNTTYFGTGKYGVVLRAKIYYEDAFFEKLFYVFVKEDEIGYDTLPLIATVRDSFINDFLRYNNVFAIKNNLIIPQIDGVTIEYSSDMPNVIDAEGKVFRDTNYEKSPEFTVIFKKGYERTMAIFPLTVTAYSTDELSDIPEQDVKDIIATLMRENSLHALMSNITLKTSGDRGSTVTWTSSDTSVIDNTGVITRAEETKTATLTVTAVFKGHTYSETITVNVKGQNSDSGGSGGGTPIGPNTGGVVAGGEPTVDIPVIPPSENPDNEYDDPAWRFSDVPPSHWAYEFIMDLANRSIVDGYDDGTYKPENKVKREEFVKMLLYTAERFEGGYTSSFTDVIYGAWYYDFVACAENLKIVNGIDETTFGVGANVSRQDAAVMICRAFDIATEDRTSYLKYNDSTDIADYAQGAVSALTDMGILEGDDDNKLNPRSHASRAEIAKLLSMIK